MANCSRMISLNRDNILQSTKQADFFTENPGLLSTKESLDQCRAAFDASARKQGCRCRADTTLLFSCVFNFLAALEAAKHENPEVVLQFVRYIAKTDDITSTCVTIYYSGPDSSAPPQRYQFP